MDAARRRGPKPQGPYADKRRTLTTRITDDLRAKLDAAAKMTDRSLSQEIEFRLHSSFDRERTFREALTSLLGGPRTEAILLTLAISANRGELLLGDRWLDDYATFHRVMNEWRRHLDRIPTPPMPDEIKDEIEMLRRLVGSLDPAREIQQSQRQHWRRVTEFVASTLVNRSDPETAIEATRLADEARRLVPDEAASEPPEDAE